MAPKEEWTSEDGKAKVLSYFDPVTSTCTHILCCTETQNCVIIDPVLDFSLETANVWTGQADTLIQDIAERGLKVVRILETHAHADHLTSSQHLKKKFPSASTSVGSHIRQVQAAFSGMFCGDDAHFRADGSQWDSLVKEGESFPVGSLSVSVLETPGHTPACVSYFVDLESSQGSQGSQGSQKKEGAPRRGLVFTGDTLFMPDVGTARCDFPGGDAEALWNSAQRLLSLGPEVVDFVGHDYPPAQGPRGVTMRTTIEAQRLGNKHIKEGTSKEEFLKVRRERDATLDPPRLLLPSIQVNIRGGHFPPRDPLGVVALRMPINKIGKHAGSDVHY